MTDKNQHTPKPGDEGWVGHKWKPLGFYSDECEFCGTQAIEGHNGLAKNREYCESRAAIAAATAHES